MGKGESNLRFLELKLTKLVLTNIWNTMPLPMAGRLDKIETRIYY